MSVYKPPPGSHREGDGRAGPSLCPGCGGPLPAGRAAFHGQPCRVRWHNRRRLLGAALLDQACRWRRYRRKGDYATLCRMIDNILAEDQAAGVARYLPPPVELIATRVKPMRKR